MTSSTIPSSDPPTISAAIAWGKARLSAHSQSAGLDSQVLLAHLISKDRAWLLAHPESQLSRIQHNDYEDLIAQLESGLALPYVLGTWEFYGLSLQLSPAVLIPRPESELLVDHALEFLQQRSTQQACLDVGTGSGCIAIAIAKHSDLAQFSAIDISEKALGLAAKNVARHKLEDRITLHHSDLLAEMSGPFDLICANLPYIPSERLPELSVSKKEPLLALDGGKHGLSLIAPFLEQAAGKLSSGALLLAEIDESHPEQITKIAKSLFVEASIEIVNDLAGKPRMLRIAT